MNEAVWARPENDDYAICPSSHALKPFTQVYKDAISAVIDGIAIMEVFAQHKDDNIPAQIELGERSPGFQLSTANRRLDAQPIESYTLYWNKSNRKF